MICLGTLPLRNPGILTWLAIDRYAWSMSLEYSSAGTSTVSFTVCLSVFSMVVCIGPSRLLDVLAEPAVTRRGPGRPVGCGPCTSTNVRSPAGSPTAPRTSAWGCSWAIRWRSAARPTASVVTQADTSIESMVREQVAAAFPDDHVLGEEEGGSADAAERVWIVDPIDATANYARGIPIWATLIALQVRRRAGAGAGERPGAERALRGCPRRGCADERPADPRERDRHDRGVPALLRRDEDLAARPRRARAPRRSALLAEATRTRGLGDFWGHTLVARGAGEAMIEPELNIWDYAAFQVVVEEAGGRVTQFDGSPTRDGGSVVSSNGLLHDRTPRAPVRFGLDATTGRSQLERVAAIAGSRHHDVGGRDVLHAQAGEVAHRELAFARAARVVAGTDPAELDRAVGSARGRAAAHRAPGTGRGSRPPGRRRVEGSPGRVPVCRRRRSRAR